MQLNETQLSLDRRFGEGNISINPRAFYPTVDEDIDDADDIFSGANEHNCHIMRLDKQRWSSVRSLSIFRIIIQ
eukprot:CAMPEP_0196825090 /NCGR_PEP_ID=MMETSP1362-20130617/92853_1 /TAXON_ID=163516 /ORGANISM="Leptocylindrus danicus, Strain CCMP1856" /LENGTH=73 /DNA_ID=CAMNT_0042205465 /DNA_START=256 /DNA_END=477 /DNA_ORIENTATION=+